MPSNITSVAGWVTPQSVATGDAISSTVWNTVASDVAMLYGKPWIFGYLTAAGTVNITSSTTLPGTTMFASANSSGTAVSVSNSPSSGLGSFSFSASTGVVTLPTSSSTTIPGLYRVTGQITANSGTGLVRLNGTMSSSSGAVSCHPGQWTAGTTSIYATSSLSFVVPVGYGTWASATNITFSAQTSAATASPQATGYSGGPTPSSTPPAFFSWFFVEYLGTSTGTF